MPAIWKRYDRRHPALENIPDITYAADGIRGDPLNVGLVGTEDDVKRIMLAAHWYPADPLTLRSCLKIASATVLARLDYRALAQGWGVAYQEIRSNGELASGIQSALDHPGPVLVRVAVERREFEPLFYIGRGLFINERAREILEQHGLYAAEAAALGGDPRVEHRAAGDLETFEQLARE